MNDEIPDKSQDQNAFMVLVLVSVGFAFLTIILLTIYRIRRRGAR